MSWWTEPRERWGRRWKQERELHPSRLRRAAWVSLGIHLLICLTIAIGIPSRPKPPVRLVGIPVHLVGLPGKAGGGGTRAGTPRPPQPTPPKPAAKKPETKAPETKPKAPPIEASTKKAGEKKPTPAKPGKEGTPVPTRQKAAEGQRQSATEAAGGDARALRTEVALPGGGSGALEIGVEGPITAYSYYLSIVRDKIASYWEPPPGSVSQLSAMISFRINRTGNVEASYVEEPSGMTLFDQAALRAVTMAAPLPPLPQEYDGEWLGIHLRFVYQD
ncbi:MAG: energy transducer TonB [Candidatus Eisenbacteria bacterium]